MPSTRHETVVGDYQGHDRRCERQPLPRRPIGQQRPARQTCEHHQWQHQVLGHGQRRMSDRTGHQRTGEPAGDRRPSRNLEYPTAEQHQQRKHERQQQCVRHTDREEQPLGVVEQPERRDEKRRVPVAEVGKLRQYPRRPAVRQVPGVAEIPPLVTWPTPPRHRGIPADPQMHRNQRDRPEPDHERQSDRCASVPPSMRHLTRHGAHPPPDHSVQVPGVTAVLRRPAGLASLSRGPWRAGRRWSRAARRASALRRLRTRRAVGTVCCSSIPWSGRRHR